MAQPHPPTTEASATLAKGLRILSEFAACESLGNGDLAGRTQLPKATISRMTSTLHALGYLRWDDGTRKFSMGERLLCMGASIQQRLGLGPETDWRLQQWAQAQHSEVLVSRLEHERVLCLKAYGPRPVTAAGPSQVRAGDALPLWHSSAGLLHCITGPLATRTRLLAQLHQQPEAQQTLAREHIAAAYRSFQQQGFIRLEEDWRPGTVGLSFPARLCEQSTFLSITLLFDRPENINPIWIDDFMNTFQTTSQNRPLGPSDKPGFIGP